MYKNKAKRCENYFLTKRIGEFKIILKKTSQHSPLALNMCGISTKEKAYLYYL